MTGEDNWIYSDTRFNLLKCDDLIFLNFLCEMIHPLVRIDASDVTILLQIFNDNLKEDSYEIVEKTEIPGANLSKQEQAVEKLDNYVAEIIIDANDINVLMRGDLNIDELNLSLYRRIKTK